MNLKGISWWSVFKILVIVLLALGASTLLLLFFIPGSPLEDALLDFLEWLDELPTWQGIAMLTLVETICTVLILPATPLNLASGFLFGVWWGSLISVSSTDMASVISFFIGRYVARGWAEKEIDKRPKFKAVDAAVEKQGMWIIILVRFSPVFPFGLCNYLFGLTKVGFWKYWIATTIGLMPYTIAYTYLGSLMRQLTDIFNDDSSDSTQQIIFLSIGGGATLMTIVVVAWITRRALKNATQEYEDDLLRAAGQIPDLEEPLDDDDVEGEEDIEDLNGSEENTVYHRIPDPHKHNANGSGKPRSSSFSGV
jgi:uncharacterized membrane protein YdjX (TVP38/TMEM64 family)